MKTPRFPHKKRQNGKTQLCGHYLDIRANSNATLCVNIPIQGLFMQLICRYFHFIANFMYAILHHFKLVYRYTLF